MKSVLIMILSFVGFSAFAATPAVQIENPRLYAPLKGSNATGGYGKVMNTSAKAVSFTFAKAEGFKAVELHESLEKDGRMAMQKIEKLEIPAKGSIELKPGGHHLMLFDATRELKENDLVTVTVLVDGKPQDIKFKVIPRVTASEGHHHH